MTERSLSGRPVPAGSVESASLPEASLPAGLPPEGSSQKSRCQQSCCQGRAHGRKYVHDVGNDGVEPAVSLHVYGPRVELMNRYDRQGARLVVLGTERASVGE